MPVLPSCPVFRRCSPRSQPNTRSFMMPVLFRVVRVGLDVKNVRRNEINLPLFRSTGDIKAKCIPLYVCLVFWPNILIYFNQLLNKTDLSYLNQICRVGFQTYGCVRLTQHVVCGNKWLKCENIGMISYVQIWMQFVAN